MTPNKPLKTALFPPAQVIDSTGANAAFLQPGESCVSLPHNFCALIVVTNGKETFVTHQARPDPERLVEELKKIKSVLPGELTVKVYQNAIDNSKAARGDKNDMKRLKSALGFGFLKSKIEYHPNIEGAYLITADGNVTSLGLPEGYETPSHPAYHQAMEDYQQDFRAVHSSQSILAQSANPPDYGDAVFKYAQLPAFATDGRAERAGMKFDSDEKLCLYAQEWNKTAEAAYHEQMMERPSLPTPIPVLHITGPKVSESRMSHRRPDSSHGRGGSHTKPAS